MDINYPIDNNSCVDVNPNIVLEMHVESVSRLITIGSILTYSIKVRNGSNFDLEKVYITEQLIPELRYQINTLRINGRTPFEGDINLNDEYVIPLGIIKKNATIIITFTVIIDRVPSQCPITSYTRLMYTYCKDDQEYSNFKLSNFEYTFFTLNLERHKITQFVDDFEICTKQIEDTVKITVIIKPLDSIYDTILENCLNENLEFISGDLFYNNELNKEITLTNNAFEIGTISAMDKVEIIFTAKIKECIKNENINYIKNEPYIKYLIKSVDNAMYASSNPIYIYIRYVSIDTCASFNNEYLKTYEIDFFVKLKNCSNILVENIAIENVIPDYLEYIENSATILYNNYLEYNFNYDKHRNIIFLPVLGVDEEITISFKVVMCKHQEKDIILDDIYLNYRYLVNPQINPCDNIYCYIENEPINNNCESYRFTADLLTTFRKEVSSEINCNKNIIDYAISFTNTGELDAYNILIEDILNGASFLSNTLKVYTDTPMGNKAFCGKLPRISIKHVCPGETIKILFSAMFNKNQSYKTITNYANLYYQYYEKECNMPINTHGRSNLTTYEIEDKIDSKLTLNSQLSYESQVGDEINYKIELVNISEVALKDIIYKLNLSVGFEKYIKYKENSLNIIGANIPINNINPNTDSIPIGTILPKEKIVIEFVEIAINTTSIPIVSFAVGEYNYTKPSCLENIKCKDETNKSCLEIVSPISSMTKQAYSYCPDNILGCISKPISTVALGDTITYKIVFANNSLYKLEDLILCDELPTSIKYINNSLEINSVKVNSGLGCSLQLPNLNPKDELIISFDVVVVSIPNNFIITNSACIKYKYCSAIGKKQEKHCVSNSVNVSYADLTQNAVKSSNPKTLSRNDLAYNSGIYTVTITNNGNIDAVNIKLIDTLPNGLKFTPNSVVVKGIDKKGNSVDLIVSSIPPGGALNIENGIIIEKLPPGVSIVTQYGFNVESNAPDVIKNTASFDYSFISNGVVIAKPNNNTSTDTLLIVNDILKISQVVSPSTVCPGDLILCSIDITNLSSDDINSVILQTTIPKNTTLVPSSFTIDLNSVNPPVTSSQLASGIDIGLLKKAPNNSKLIQYQLKITDATINPIYIINNIYYKNGSTKSKTYTLTSSVNLSNNCPVNPTGFVDITKGAFSYCSPNSINCTVSPVTIVSVNDIVTYKIPIRNISAFDLKDVIFDDNLPPGISYIDNSLKVNGVTVPSNSISNLPLGTLKPNEIFTVSFDALVLSTTKPNNILNTACVTYKYKTCSDCEQQQRTDCASNKLAVISPNLQTNFAKYIDSVGTTENFKKPYDNMSYIIQFGNSGNQDAFNVVLIDTIPNDFGYFLNSIVVTPSIPFSNITQPTGDNYVLKIKFDTIPKGVSYKVEFKGFVQTTLPSGKIYNNANLSYSYISASTSTISTSTVASNTVITNINSANLVIKKSASTSETDINVPVTYTINIKNTGNVNANNIYVQDLLPQIVQFVPNTLKVNGLPSTADINSGILIGTLAPGGFATIEFAVVAKTAPQFNPISNTANASYTYVSNPFTGVEEDGFTTSNQVLLFIKAADLISVTPTKQSDTFAVSPNNPANNSGNYNITLYNAGNTNALNVVVIDTMPNGVSFVPNTVIITGKNNSGTPVTLSANSIPPGGPLNIENGITIVDIPPYVTANIKFGFTSTSDEFEFVENTANFNYSYAVNQALVTVPNVPTTTATIAIVKDALKVTKLVDPDSACTCKPLLYTIIIENHLTTTISNIILQDTIPLGLSMINDSFTLNFKEFLINNNPVTAANLAQGIILGNLPIAARYVAQFLVNVNKNNNLGGSFVNKANVKYLNGTIPSTIYSASVTVTTPLCCSSCCNNDCDCSCNCNNNSHNSYNNKQFVVNNIPSYRNKKYIRHSSMQNGRNNIN